MKNTRQPKSKGSAAPTQKGSKFGNWLRKLGLIKAKEIETKDITSKDVVIAVMGATGAGKSTFIETICGVTGRAGHTLESCTQDISVVRVSFVEHPDSNICFVDTPGFDDTYRSDLETFGMISKWMIETYRRMIPLSGVLYFHDISINRMGGTKLENLGRFEKLCGEDTKVVLTTTMWETLINWEIGLEREKELKDDYWKSMIERGSSVKRFLRNRQSALDVLSPIFDHLNQQTAVGNNSAPHPSDVAGNANPPVVIAATPRASRRSANPRGQDVDTSHPLRSGQHSQQTQRRTSRQK